MGVVLGDIWRDYCRPSRISARPFPGLSDPERIVFLARIARRPLERPPAQRNAAVGVGNHYLGASTPRCRVSEALCCGHYGASLERQCPLAWLFLLLHTFEHPLPCLRV